MEDEGLIFGLERRISHLRITYSYLFSSLGVGFFNTVLSFRDSD